MTPLWTGKHLEAVDDGGWEFVRRRGDLAAVMIVATDADHLLLIEQHRPPAGGPVLELPAGLIGDDGGDESAATAAARELEEETGWRAERIEVGGTYVSSPGLTSERFTVVRATGLSRVGEGGGVGSERITVHRVAVANVAAFVAARRAAGVAIDAKLVMLLGVAGA